MTPTPDASSSPVDAATLERFADLLVLAAANVQPGQIVQVGAEIGKEALARAVAASAYRHGATYVDVNYLDQHIRRARVLYGSDEALATVPSWIGERLLAFGEQRCARIGLTGLAAPGVLDDLPPARLGADRSQTVPESGKIINDRTTNWTVAPCPTPAWAELVHADLPPAEAYAKLWQQIIHICRLDEPDPAAAWEQDMRTLTEITERLTAARYDAIHFEGPGTDLTIGLLPSSRWRSTGFETVDGIRHIANLPSEEVFTTPDPLRADGVVRSTKPLIVSGGARVDGLTVRFEGGRAVQIDAERGGEMLRAMTGRDEGASRLGEVALVDGRGRIGPLETIFYDTLIDENTTSHVALGNAYQFAVEDPDDVARANRSQIHVDFMIGGADVDVTGVRADGERVPLLRGGVWAS